LYNALDPKTYLELAFTLSSESQDTAIRTAADRAYYAAFLASRDILAAKGYITPYYNQQDHQYVATELKRLNVSGWFGNEENRLRRARNLITYDTRQIDSSQPDARPVRWMLDTARRIIELVEGLPPKS